jgi:hypothetical protein
MVRVFSGGMSPPVEFGVEYGEIKGVVTGASAEPSSSSLCPISPDKTCPAVVELREYLCEVVGVRFTGLVVRVSPS